jgi:magnesium-protoporphyrin O-methyltransferase
MSRLRRRGPDPGTRRLLGAIRAATLPPDPTLLDIGGGVGAIHHLLLDQGFRRATHVDTSTAYLAVAAEEAQRLGHADRVSFRHADFRDVVAELPPADVVTLDRVVCCDADYAGLLEAAADRTRLILGFTFPRARWYTRGFVAVANAWRRIRGATFRAHVHPPAAMMAVLEKHGLRRSWSGGNWIWAVEVFERTA